MNRRRLIILMHGGKIDACLAAAKRRKGSGYGQGQTKTDYMQIRDTGKRGPSWPEIAGPVHRLTCTIQYWQLLLSSGLHDIMPR